MVTRLVHSHHPSALCRKVHKPLSDLTEIGKRGRILRDNSCKYVAELRSGWEAGGPSRGAVASNWPLAAACQPAGSTVPGELSACVHMQSGLINSAVPRATCFN